MDKETKRILVVISIAIAAAALLLLLLMGYDLRGFEIHKGIRIH